MESPMDPRPDEDSDFIFLSALLDIDGLVDGECGRFSTDGDMSVFVDSPAGRSMASRHSHGVPNEHLPQEMAASAAVAMITSSTHWQGPPGVQEPQVTSTAAGDEDSWWDMIWAMDSV